MFSMLLDFLKKSLSSKWLFISVPILLGILVVIIGFSLLPDRPKKFFSNKLPLLELNLATYCADDSTLLGRYTGKGSLIDSLISQHSKVVLTRTGAYEFDMVVDIFGLIENKSNIFSKISFVEQFLFSKQYIGEIVVNPKKPTPDSLKHHCEKIRVIFNPDESIIIKPSGEIWLEYDKNRTAKKLVLKKTSLDLKSISDFQLLLIKEENAANGFEIELPATNSEGTPPVIVGVRFSIKCEQCLRGNNLLTDLAMSLFLLKRGGGGLLNQMHFLPVHAIANEQYIPTKWDGQKNIKEYEYTESGYDLILNTESFASTLFSTWIDLDAERKISGVFTLAGVVIGLGLTLIVEGFIATLYYFFHVRSSKKTV